MIIWPWIRVPAGDLSIIKTIFGEALNEMPSEAGKDNSWESLWAYAQNKQRSLIVSPDERGPYYICIWPS